MIKPTIGRVVWLWPASSFVNGTPIAYTDQTLPLAATVAYVWHDRMVNLAAVDQNGKAFNMTSVLLMQGDEAYAPVGAYCEWMPFQKGQAAKGEPTEDALTSDTRSTPVAQVTDDMVSRFLGWTFPLDFAPDGGISFKHSPMATWPVGTNLLNGTQARAMLERVLSVVTPVSTTESVRLTPVEPSLSPFDFGGALNVLRLGGKVARTGWNGKGMWVTLAGPVEGASVNHEKLWSPNNAQFAKDQPDGAVTVNPYFTIKNTDNTISNWVPSTGDILALDWVTVQ